VIRAPVENKASHSPQANNPACESFVGDVFRRLRDAGTAPEAVAQNFLKLADQPWISLRTLDFTGHLFKDQAEAIATQLATPAAQPVMQGKFATWSTQNPDQVGQWLNKNIGSALYDVGAAELSRSLLASDPEAAATWARTIKDAT
jgi:CTP:molybdopterin cytidylyltransferase MocA